MKKRIDPLTFLAHTNPFTFLLVTVLRRGEGDDRYRELLQSRPYGPGGYGILVAFIIIAVLLLIAVTIMAGTGQVPTHGGPHFP